MGFLSSSSTPALGTIDAPPSLSEETGSIIGAALRSQNVLFSGLSREEIPGPSDGLFEARQIDPAFDPITNLEPQYREFAESFVFANSEEEVRRIKRQIDREQSDRRIIEDAGGVGLAAELFAGIADPINFVPVGGTAIRGFRLSERVGRAAGQTAAAGLLTTTAAEALLHGSQETRTVEESLFAVGTGTVLSGILGGALGALSKRAQTDVARKFERDMVIPERDVADDLEPAALTDAPIKTRGARIERDTLTVPIKEELHTPRTKPVSEIRARAPDDAETFVSLPDGARVVRAPDGSEAFARVPDVLRDPTTELPLVIRRQQIKHINSPVRTRDVERSGIEFQDGLHMADFVAQNFTEIRQAPGPGRIVLAVRREPNVIVVAEARRAASGDRFEVITTGIRRDSALDGMVLLREVERDPTQDVTGGDPSLSAPPGHRAGPDGDASATSRSIDDSIENSGDDFNSDDGPIGEGGSVGAASTVQQIEGEGLASTLGVAKSVKFEDPMLRLLHSPAVSSRRILQQLAEIPLALAKNLEGKATPVSVETRIKLNQAKLAMGVRATLVGFMKHRGLNRRIGIPATGVRDLVKGTPDGLLTFKQFKEEIGRAMRRNDTHEIPEVAEAAKVWRKHLYEPLKDDAVDVDLLDADLDPKTAASYLNRSYRREIIIAKRPEFVGRVTDWLEARQARRAAIQEELAELLEDEATLRSGERRAAGRLGTSERRRAIAETRLAEQRTALRNEVERSFDLTDREGANATGRKAEVSRRITALRNRVNALHDRASGHSFRSDELGRFLEDLKERHRATLEDIDGALAEFPIRGRLEGVRDARRALRTSTDLDRQELRDIADQITDRILSTPDGRLPYDNDVGDIRPRDGGQRRPDVRGPLQGRRFLIPDEQIEEFLENDIEVLARSYTRSISADVELVRAFDTVGMDDAIDTIRRDFNDLIARAEGESARRRLRRQMDNDIRDVAGIRDRLRGTYGMPGDPDSIIVRASRVVRSLNYLRLLGGMTVSAFPDVAKPIMVHGMVRTFGAGLVPLIQNARALRLAGDEVKLAGSALDMTLDQRAMAIADVFDDYGRLTGFERGIRALTDNFGVVSLMAPWNAALKQFSGVVTMSRMFDGALAAKAGRLSDKEAANMAAMGLDSGMLRRIADQFNAHGETVDGIKMANTAEWTDAAAVTAFRAALVREVDRIIVTPGQDRPLMMSTELGKLVFQFKSFAIASVQRTLLAGLQQRDAAVLNGAALSIGLGMITYKVKMALAGRDTSEDPETWIKEGIDRSGMLGWFFEANSIVETLTRGNVGIRAITGGEPLSRFVSRNFTGKLLGPTAGLAEDIATSTGAIFAGDFKATDTRRVRRLLPYQNLFYMRGVLDEAEEGVNEALGIPPRK